MTKTVEFKFDIGDEVYYVDSMFTATKGFVIRCRCVITSDGCCDISYWVGPTKTSAFIMEVLQSKIRKKLEEIIKKSPRITINKGSLE